MCINYLFISFLWFGVWNQRCICVDFSIHFWFCCGFAIIIQVLAFALREQEYEFVKNSFYGWFFSVFCITWPKESPLLELLLLHCSLLWLLPMMMPDSWLCYLFVDWTVGSLIDTVFSVILGKQNVFRSYMWQLAMALWSQGGVN